MPDNEFIKSNNVCACCGGVLKAALFMPTYPLLTSACPKDAEVPMLPLSVATCSNCSHVQLDQQPTKEALDIIYQGDYTNVIPKGVIPQADQMALDCKNFLDFAFPNGLKKEDPVLEIGCFDGSFLALFEGHPLWGVEPNKVGDIARDTYGVEVKPVYFEQGLYPDRSVGLVVMRHLIEHVPDPQALLATCKAVLKPHGALLIETPNIEHTLEHKVIGNFYHQHLQYFTKRSLCQLLAQNGWEVLGHGIRDFRQFVVCRPCDEFAPRPENDLYGPLIREQVAGYQTHMSALKKDCADWFAKNEGMVAIYGGSSTATGMVHVAGVPLDRIAFAVDRDPCKQGKVLPGTQICVEPPERLAEGEVATVLIASDFFKMNILDVVREKFSAQISRALFLHPAFEEIELNS